MTGLVLVSHGGVARELLEAAEMILGPQEGVRAVAIGREQSVEAAGEELRQAIAEAVRPGDGALVMTDMFGGTPANLGIAFLEPGRVEVLTGVNLPMVLKFFALRAELEPAELAVRLQEHGQQNIHLASRFLEKAGERKER